MPQNSANLALSLKLRIIRPSRRRVFLVHPVWIQHHRSALRFARKTRCVNGLNSLWTVHYITYPTSPRLTSFPLNYTCTRSARPSLSWLRPITALRLPIFNSSSRDSAAFSTFQVQVANYEISYTFEFRTQHSVCRSHYLRRVKHGKGKAAITILPVDIMYHYQMTAFFFTATEWYRAILRTFLDKIHLSFDTEPILELSRSIVDGRQPTLRT